MMSWVLGGARTADDSRIQNKEGLVNDCGTGLLLTSSAPATEDSTGARTGECATAADDAARTIAGIALFGLATGLVGTVYVILTGPRQTRRPSRTASWRCPWTCARRPLCDHGRELRRLRRHDRTVGENS
jgi:hypothetical protein